MQRLILSLSLILIGSATAYAVQKSVVCHMKGLEGTISFAVPNKIGDLPEVDFDYPATATRFSMRTGNLLLVAMDQDEKDRPRIFISAQLNKKIKPMRANIWQILVGINCNWIMVQFPAS